MAPERWQRIEQLYHSALGLASEVRAAYLAAECAGDEELRREVESLIANGREGGTFLERPSLEVVAEQYVSAATPNLARRTLGRYEIISRLGAGGMGEVYRARDTRLDREVALKVLPPEWTADHERKRRFELEARAASALHHPNIVTIFDIDQVDGVNFIAMEYVPGKTLDQMIPRRGLPPHETLKYAVEIGAALTAAHGVGIVHRDIKPSNIMVNATGQVKVLDFGLAKLVEPARAGDEGAAVSLQPRTEEGAVVGTASYMSPEQAQGKPVDARSDIFSFGSVLYEMATGRRAFRGDTKISTLAAVIGQQPALGAVAPRDLQKVIARCLRKDPGRRFQHMDDVLVGLQELREESSPPPGTRAAVRPSRQRWLWAAVVAVTLAGAAWWYRGARKPPSPMNVVPLTSYPGSEIYPSFSPDGNRVAFSWNGEKQDNFDIYVKLIGSPTPVRLTSDAAADLSPAFSPDGRSIGFIRAPEKGGLAFVIIPAIGGPERVVASLPAALASNATLLDFCFARPGLSYAWLPSGKHVVTRGLTLLSVETGEARTLTSPPPDVRDFSPAVSPDGGTLAFSRGSHESDLYLLHLGADLRPKGHPRRVTSLKRYSNSPVWSPDSRKIIFTAGDPADLWTVAASGFAEPEQFPVYNALTPAISRTGNRLVYAQEVRGEDIWRVSLSDSGKAVGPPTRFISSTRNEDHPQYSPDGKRIAFESDRGGSNGIWVCNADGSNCAELYSKAGANSGSARWAPDGKRLAFDSTSAGNSDIYVIRSDGGKPVQLTTDPAEHAIPSWSADGKWLYFASNRSGQFEVWKAPAAGGSAVQVTRNGGLAALESRDGKSVYYTKTWGNTGLWKMPVSGGEETLVIPSIVRWTYAVIDHGIYFELESPPGKYSIQFLAFATGEVRTISPLSAYADGLSVSPGERSLLYVQSDEAGADLMLVENFQP